MEKLQHVFEYIHLSIDELKKDQKELIAHAIKMSLLAYAPYSNFKVGAAVLLENGNIIGGNNQENIASPSGLCAERVALLACKAQFPSVKIKAIAIVSSQEDRIITPCGGCRQVMYEVVKRQEQDFDVIMASSKEILIARAGDLIPLAFKY